MPFDPLPPRPTTVRLMVPDRCRRWAHASGVPLHVLLQSLVEFSGAVLDVVPVSSAGAPTPSQLLSAVSVLAPAPARGSGPSALSSQLLGDAAAVPSPELAALSAGADPRACPVLLSRLRSYAAASRLVHPGIGGDDHIHLVAAYAVAVGVPRDLAGRVAGVVVDALRRSSSR